MTPPIVFLHGWGRTGRDFKPLRKLLSQEQACFSFDLPGFGEVLPPPEPWSANEYARWLATRLEEENITHTVFVGHSFGARVAAVFAAEHPEVVAGLILIGAPLVRSLTLKRRIFILAAKLWRLVRWLPGAGVLQRKLEGWLQKRHYSMDILLTAEGVMRETLKRVIVQDLRPSLSRIKAPILLVYGERDMVTPPALGQRALSYIPHAKLVTIPEAGHMVMLERPEEVAEAIEKFLMSNYSNYPNQAPMTKTQ